MLLLKTKEIQKGSSILLLSQLFLIPLEITPTVKLGGVSLGATQQPARTKSCHMGKICMEKTLELAPFNIFNDRDSTDAEA